MPAATIQRPRSSRRREVGLSKPIFGLRRPGTLRVETEPESVGLSQGFERLLAQTIGQSCATDDDPEVRRGRIGRELMLVLERLLDRCERGDQFAGIELGRGTRHSRVGDAPVRLCFWHLRAQFQPQCSADRGFEVPVFALGEAQSEASPVRVRKKNGPPGVELSDRRCKQVLCLLRFPADASITHMARAAGEQCMSLAAILRKCSRVLLASS